jgi:endonuclease YncB( thermonuclease family)
MIDSTIKTYATRQGAAAVLAIVLALMLILGLGGAPRPGRAGPIASTVIEGPARVLDGDSLVVGGQQIRLEGIDAPEIGQTCRSSGDREWDCGRIAALALQRLVANAHLRCAIRGLDRYDRMLATCSAAGRDLNAEMVRLGFAWAFVRYSRAYVREEAEARGARAGIWNGPSVPAWEYRAAR